MKKKSVINKQKRKIYQSRLIFYYNFVKFKTNLNSSFINFAIYLFNSNN